ncbi:asparagine--tRNA ligase [Candidatus Falkowbacteria bacterium CG10_big_fil_rev_8_21_14_0_10_39_11]|uniref:Asparagine--tRNA ligase n=1 Tax=Candidatus Falkowbacteria bacterium CG10_big_fil_rev_8_21_14_0_10_39_11 TaxID=1974565 RepID=A0A2H0V5G4_9BACT|nr:MAG: asparagine--tRNA ligase [Candidatus Falkowbacteria bacterium CG10_big_fil_rev_8_21_14_0_10_39_11]
MEQVYIKDLKDHKEKEVLLQGWVYNFRSSGSIAFLQVRDGSGFTQAVVVKDEVSEDTWKEVERMTIESSVEVSGVVSQHPKKEDVFELQANEVKILQLAEEYPIGKKEHGPDFLLNQRHLWLRSPKQASIQKVRNTVINATYEYLAQEGFTKFDSPILTPTSCEGTTELFEMEYFDLGKAYLTQSGQLYLEAGIFALGKVFDFGPVFRAEKSKTRRHLTEFWMMDAEMAFYSHEDSMKLQENLISYIAEKVIERNLSDLEILERDVEKLKKVKAPFDRMTYHEAVKKLQELGSDIKDGEDLGGDDEDLIMKETDKPLFIERWPAEIKAFYMRKDENGLALCSDLIAPEGHGEVIGGSERETDYETLKKRMEEEKLPMDAFEWYLDLRKYGSVQHSGFGYGLERLTGWMCGIHHVRETIPFPRMINRITP